MANRNQVQADMVLETFNSLLVLMEWQMQLVRSTISKLEPLRGRRKKTGRSVKPAQIRKIRKSIPD